VLLGPWRRKPLCCQNICLCRELLVVSNCVHPVYSILLHVGVPFVRWTCTANLWIAALRTLRSGSDGNWLENYTCTCSVQHCDGVWRLSAPAVGPGYAARKTRLANCPEIQQQNSVNCTLFRSGASHVGFEICLVGHSVGS
jgi:hypothetical protein